MTLAFSTRACRQTSTSASSNESFVMAIPQKDQLLAGAGRIIISGERLPGEKNMNVPWQNQTEERRGELKRAIEEFSRRKPDRLLLTATTLRVFRPQMTSRKLLGSFDLIGLVSNQNLCFQRSSVRHRATRLFASQPVTSTRFESRPPRYIFITARETRG